MLLVALACPDQKESNSTEHLLVATASQPLQTPPANQSHLHTSAAASTRHAQEQKQIMPLPHPVAPSTCQVHQSCKDAQPVPVGICACTWMLNMCQGIPCTTLLLSTHKSQPEIPSGYTVAWVAAETAQPPYPAEDGQQCTCTVKQPCRGQQKTLFTRWLITRQICADPSDQSQHAMLPEGQKARIPHHTSCRHR